jgi:hypothetical protein
MAINGKTSSRNRMIRGRPRRKLEQAAGSAFGLLSIAIARLW